MSGSTRPRELEHAREKLEQAGLRRRENQENDDDDDDNDDDDDDDNDDDVRGANIAF